MGCAYKHQTVIPNGVKNLGPVDTTLLSIPIPCHSERSEESKMLKGWIVSLGKDFRPFGYAQGDIGSEANVICANRP